MLLNEVIDNLTHEVVVSVADHRKLTMISNTISDRCNLLAVVLYRPHQC